MQQTTISLTPLNAPHVLILPPTPTRADHDCDSDLGRGRAKTLSPADRKVRLINIVAVLLPIAALAAALTWSWGSAFNWTQAIISVSMSMFTALGITVGYHRLFTHRSFVAVAPVRALLAVAGSMAVQGPVIEWAGAHRKHHQHSDSEKDPHSPHCHDDDEFEGGVRGMLRGLYHAHVGWLFVGRAKGLGKYTKDLHADPLLSAINKQFVMWVLIGLLLPTLVAGLVTWSIEGALLGFLWGGLIRVLAVHHITWSVNSVCHLWGTSPFRSGDHSRNNAIVGVLAMGEGWHNNHHAFPTSARHGLRWWELDVSYMLICAMAAIGLARDVKVPTKEKMESRRKAA